MAKNFKAVSLCLCLSVSKNNFASARSFYKLTALSTNSARTPELMERLSTARINDRNAQVAKGPSAI